MNNDSFRLYTTPLEYLDFELEISSRSGSQYSIAVMHSPAGEARASMTLPRHRQQLSQHLASLLMWGRDDGQEFGTELFNATIAGEIRGRYYMSKEIAASQDKGLRVKMRIQPTELAALPWELLYDPCEAEFVCLSSNTPIVRYLELPQRIQPLTVALPLQILGMVASPSDQPPLDVESEKQQIEWAIQELRSQGLVELQWSEGQTWRDLQRAMRKGPCHVFHFIGHGGFDRDAAEGFIALASKTGDTDRLSASQLARLLADCRSLRLVFLNSCEGARHSDLEVYSSTASMLVRRGIPAVLAMQNKISNTAAIEFSRAFYEAVADGFPIDAAVAEARKSLSLAMPDTLEWSNSALYMRTPDGVLFQVPRRLSTTRSFVVSKKSAETTLRDELEDTIGLYLSTSFERDQFARLDQAGETDPDRTTLLRQVFVDLEVKSRAGRLPRRLMPMSLFGEHEQTENGLHIAEGEDTSSAMGCFLDEIWPKIVVIGGPGHGKSTLGQYLAQVHRAILLGRHAELVDESLGDLQMQEFIPRTPRVPFRIILKYFAQWLAEDPSVDTLEAYLADQMEKSTSREISPADIQAIMSAYPCLMVLDGLDEVMEGDSRSRLLAQVQEFLSRAEQLGANLQILATSRPTGYSDQFDPEIYWHIELQPMSSDKVSYFANKWARAKIPILEERQRVIDTLKECQQEEHTHLLLATPLQVTIVLLIIKDGGRPPAQREALFHEYWGTIFRREKAKAKGVIRSEESLLFDLHAYLAYLLHRRAAGKDVRSLLPESEFKKTVHRFLRGKDQYSPEEDIVKRSDQMIKEAKDRLVLLVSPEPGLFGFELRSLQEFFAAAYLAQTAKSTHQRFQRLKAIARSEHWRNVALFFAGRIVRSFGGEAANILELVCRPIDRNLPDLYLRRGAWLALEIAADGAFAAHRDLQYGAVEFALTVLRSGLNRRDVERIRAALKRLPMDDHRDIVKPLLKQMVIDLPTFCLIDGLDIYGEVVGPDELFMNGLKSLLPNSQEEHTQAVLDLAVQHRADPKWLAVQLNRYWPMWMKWQRGYNFVRWWEQAHTFVQEVLVEWAPSEEHVRRLLQSSLSNFWRLGRLSGDPIWDLPDQVESFTEQAIAAVQGLPILNMLHMFDISTGEEIGLQKYPGIGLCDVEYRYRKSQASAVLDTVEEKLEKLMSHSALLPQLRAVLWGLYWASHEPTESSVQSFMHDLECLNDDVVPESFFNYTLRKTWPLLGLAVRRQRKGDLEAVQRLKPYLNQTNEIAINRKVRESVRSLAQRANEDEWWMFLLGLQAQEWVDMPELNPIAKELGLKVGELVNSQVAYWRYQEAEVSLSSRVVQHMLSLIFEGAQSDSDEARALPSFLLEGKWHMDREALTQGRHLLSALLTRLPERTDLAEPVIILFLKLLANERSVLAAAPDVLISLSNLPETAKQMSTWAIAQLLIAIDLEAWAELAQFTNHENVAIQRGALILWEALLDAILSEYMLDELGHLKVLRFDWALGLCLIDSTEDMKKKQGIALLTLSNYPISDEGHRERLLNALMRSGDDEEIGLWARFLREFPIAESQVMAWRSLLESILAQPRTCPSAILIAAKTRYSVLVCDREPDVIGNTVALRLALDVLDTD